MSERWGKMLLLLPLLLPLPGRAQYVGKVGQGAGKPQPLRATAVYEFTGDMAKPNASRLVPVVVWDGQHYQPGALYLAQPEPLAVAPGTQYVLEESGVPKGFFDIGSAGQLNGSWVGLGRYAAEVPKPTAAQLAASRHLPQLHGGHGKGRADDDDDASEDGPVLHRHADSDTGNSAGKTASAGGSNSADGSGSAGATPAPAPDPDRPTLHTRGGSSGDAKSAPPPDPDRPVLHTSSASAQTGDAAGAGAPDADRPRLKASRGAAAETVVAPDPDRPHLRYGAVSDEGRVMPTELKDVAAGADGAGGAADGMGVAGAAENAPVKIGQVVGISDTSLDVGNPHPFAYAWPSPDAEAAAQAGMHALALKALATAAQASFGPAAKTDAALRAAALAQSSFGPGTASGAATQTNASSGTKTGARTGAKRATSAGTKAADAQPDPLADAEFHAFELSYGGGTTYVYTAHTAPTGAARRYVTVMAQPDFYGKPEQLFAQTTRGDMLRQVPALHFIDAVDTDGDHRAELLFDEQTSPRGGEGVAQASQRQFAIYSVVGGTATEVYTSDAH